MSHVTSIDFVLIHISDTHLSSAIPAHNRGWRAAAAYIRQRKPDLVIHTGDIIDDETSEADRLYARVKLESLGVEWVAIPGNHDIGDGPPAAGNICPERLAEFEKTFGATHWSRRVGEWRVIGVNAMLLGSGSPGEADHWLWLEKCLAASTGTRSMLCIHKPPFLLNPGESQHGTATMPEAARRRFWDLIVKSGIKLIACGHRHEYRMVQRDGVGIVWAPTTSGLPAEMTPPILSNAPGCGLVEYVISGDTVAHRVVTFPIIGGSHDRFA